MKTPFSADGRLQRSNPNKEKRHYSIKSTTDREAVVAQIFNT